MNLVRRAMLFCAVGLLAASAANAGVPNATASTQPSPTVIKVMALHPGPQTSAPAAYTIRDASLNPVPGSVVVFNFSACSDVRLSQVDAGPGMSINCAAKTITGVTNATGQVSMVVIGGASAVGAGVFLPTKCVSVTADGVPLNNLNAATCDFDLSAGVSLLDVSASFAHYTATGQPAHPVTSAKARDDINGDGQLTLLDVSALFGAYVSGGGGGGTSVSTWCSTTP